jgi:hypothetical protein
MRRAIFYRRRVLALAGTAIAFLVGCQLAIAQDVEDATREACKPDAMRLCGWYVPNVEQITKCMSERIADVTPQCRAAMIKEDHRARARLQEHHESTSLSGD